MKKTPINWISIRIAGFTAVAFYVLSGFAHPTPLSKPTAPLNDAHAVLGAGAFKHDLYFGDDRDTLPSLAPKEAHLLTYYGG